MTFTPLTIIAGTNASGKSNLFDALMLVSSLAESDNIKKSFKKQRGEFVELFTQYGEGKYVDEMEFCIEMLVNKKVKDAWGSETILKYTRLRYELKLRHIENDSGIQDIELVHERLISIKHKEDKWVNIIPTIYREEWRPKVEGRRGVPYIDTTMENGVPAIIVPQDGTQGNKRRFPLNNATRTVLSSFDSIDFPHVLAAKEEMRSWKFLQLNPEDLRKPTDKYNGEDKINASGKNLAAALYRISQKNEYSLNEISRKLNSFISNFIEVRVIDDKENKQYIIKLLDKDGREYTSRVLSEGTLRILTLCILEQDDQFTGLLCFEEPENGIHPSRIDTMISLLKNLTNDFTDEEQPLRQVLVNTHSPKLVRIITKWQKDKNVSLWYSKMINRTTTIGNERVNFSISDILPVDNENHTQPYLPFTDSQRKLTSAIVSEYLETTDNPF